MVYNEINKLLEFLISKNRKRSSQVKIGKTTIQETLPIMMTHLSKTVWF